MSSEHAENKMNVNNVLKVSEFVKMIAGAIIAIVTIVVTVMLWIQSQGQDDYYPKLAGENLERQLVRIERHMDGIEQQNREIIRILGQIEGRTRH